MATEFTKIRTLRKESASVQYFQMIWISVLFFYLS
jgi:hypothetical protein